MQERKGFYMREGGSSIAYCSILYENCNIA